ncbi:MAG: hypothetical protein AAF170_14200 [Bacteroidota bacterium]
MDTTTPRPTRSFWNPDRSIRATIRFLLWRRRVQRILRQLDSDA